MLDVSDVFYDVEQLNSAQCSCIDLRLCWQYYLNDTVRRSSDLPGFSEPFIPVKRPDWGLNDIAV